MNIYMIGLKADSGGVAVHTKEMLKYLSEFKDLNIKFFDYYNSKIWRPHGKDFLSIYNNFMKIYRLTIVLFFNLLYYREKIDIIHVQASGPLGGFLPAVFAIIYNIILKKKLVITYHDPDTDIFIDKYTYIFKKILIKCDKLIVVSHYQKEIIIKKFGYDYSSKIIVLYNGFTKRKIINKNIARKYLHFDGNIKIFLNIGILIKRKNHDLLINAIDKFLTNKDINRSNIKLIIIGDGPERDNILHLIKSKHLEDNVILTGYIKEEQLNFYYSSADYFIITSNKEANPIVIVEALSYGMPVLSTDVGGIKEIINSNDYGLLSSPNNLEYLVNNINYSYKKKWNNKTIQKYADIYKWDNIANNTYKIYKKIHSLNYNKCDHNE